MIPAPIAMILFKCFLHTISAHNHLLSPIQWKELSYHTSTINDDKWFRKYVKIYDIPEYINALTEGLATFVVDGSFFLNHFKLISASWVLVNSSYRILASGDFLSTLAIAFHHSATTESCEVLVIYFTLDKILQMIQSPPTILLIRISIDYQAVIDSL